MRLSTEPTASRGTAVCSVMEPELADFDDETAIVD